MLKSHQPVNCEVEAGQVDKTSRKSTQGSFRMSRQLAPEKLRRKIDPELFEFESTSDIPPLRKPLGQQRAMKAIHFGLEVESQGYNLFVLGPPGAGKHSTTTAILEDLAKSGQVPPDWVYVYNFANPAVPLAIELNAGLGEKFRDDIATLVEQLKSEIPKAFGDELYSKEKSDLLSAGHDEKTVIFTELEELATDHNFLVQRTADGLSLIYTHDGEPLSPDNFEKLDEKEQQKIQGSRDVLQDKLRETVRQLKRVDKETKDAVTALDGRVGLAAVGHEIEVLEEKYNNRARVVEFLVGLKTDILANIEKFRTDGHDSKYSPLPFMPAPEGPDEVLKRYIVNLFVNNKKLKTAPVVFESNPSFHNLLGRIEHTMQYGAFVTDYTMLKAGAFHRANGGYLVLNAREVLLNPFAYEAMKRVLKDQQINMEEVGEQYRVVATASLKPEPIPSHVKVILLGTPWLYYLLQTYDEDFHKLFKVKGEFALDMDCDQEGMMSYAFLIASQCAREGLTPFGRDAVARIVEHGLRMAESKEKLSTGFLGITDLVREAHYWAKKESLQLVEPRHIQQAIDENIYRNDYVEERLAQMIEDGTILIDLEGEVDGQINGLAVYGMGDYAFGKPSRVTARVYMGKEGVSNIDRESDLGGPIHNKGAMILQGFFGARYAQKVPITFGATICFEQSYGGIEGDSASSVELFALISAIAAVPIKQNFAVTGSVNQMGQIQAVGGINLKIEGFFKTCKMNGLTGDQGVIIPESNVKNLMLREEVVKAVEDGLFNIYPISTVDEGMELLTGKTAGREDVYGDYPAGTINAKVVARLERFTRQWRQLHIE